MYNAVTTGGADKAAVPLDDPGADERFDAVVLGAGISGLVAASILLEQGCEQVLVVDEYDHVGGNHIDRRIGDYTFDVGSFIFQDDSPLLRRFPELLPHYVPIEPAWGRLNPQGVVTRYPISVKEDLLGAGPVEWGRIFASVLISRMFRRGLRNARDFAQYWIGARLLQRSGLGHYMERFYGLPPEQIDIGFARKRMLWIEEHALLRTHLRRLARRSEATSANTQLVRPRAGFAALYRPAVEQLVSRGACFRLGVRLDRLRREGAAFVLEAGARPVTAGRVISTVPLERIQELCGLGGGGEMRAMTLLSLFFSFSGERGFAQPILYNFSAHGAWKRLTMHSDFYGCSGGREFFAVEVNADHVDGSVERAEQDFRAHLEKNGLFRGDLRLEGSHLLSNAYPIYTGNAGEAAARAVATLRAFGVESIGRQGRFDYQPTARDSTLKAEAALGAAT
jgi:hypothetical protein